MNINKITYVLHDLVSSFYENNNLQIIKIFKNKNDYFLMYFILKEMVSFNPEQLKGSHENLIIEVVKQNIEKLIIDKDSNNLNFEINYNFSSSISHKIKIIMIKLNHENDIILFDKEEEIYVKNKKNKLEKEKKELQDLIWKQKIYTIICSNNKGIELSKIINKTRGIKNPETRKKYLRALINENKIDVFLDNSNKKPKNIYKVK